MLSNKMVRTLSLLIIATALVFAGIGCNSSSPAASTTTAPPAIAANKPAKTAATGSSNTDPGILPIGGGAMTPVTNPGAVDGAGSNVGQMAKEAAKSAAAKEGQSTAGQPNQSGGDE